MITPRFSLTQDENTVTFVIRAPYCNLRDLEITIEDEVFIFLCKPYYLRLHLPGCLNEDSRNTKSSYDADTGEFVFTYGKAIAGEHFPDLDLITKLLCTKVDVTEGKRKIEVLIESETEAVIADQTPEFGFAMRGRCGFNYVSSEFREVFEINPYEIPLKDRRRLRLLREDKQFNRDHYICDMIDDDQIQECLCLVAPWRSVPTEVTFNSKELDFLKDISNKDYKLSPVEISYCHNGLLEILFAYCYDRRTTDYEGTCESGWTISKLCAGLSWFDAFTSPNEAVISSFRRSLIYPLYRNFKLSQKILQDVKDVLRLGERYIIKCLIDIHGIFLHNERYILNNLFIEDYIVYIMKWDKELWQRTVDNFNKIEVRKGDLGLSLETIESSASNELSLCETIQNLSIVSKDSDSDNSDTTDSSESSDSSESDGGQDSSCETSDLESTAANKVCQIK